MQNYDIKKTALNLLAVLKDIKNPIVTITSSEETKGADHAAKLLFYTLLSEINGCEFLDLYNKKEYIPFKMAKEMINKASIGNELTLILLPPLLNNNFTLPFVSNADGVLFIEKLHFCKKSNIQRTIDAVDITGTRKLGFILI